MNRPILGVWFGTLDRPPQGLSSAHPEPWQSSGARTARGATRTPDPDQPGAPQELPGQLSVEAAFCPLPVAEYADEVPGRSSDAKQTHLRLFILAAAIVGALAMTLLVILIAGSRDEKAKERVKAAANTRPAPAPRSEHQPTPPPAPQPEPAPKLPRVEPTQLPDPGPEPEKPQRKPKEEEYQAEPVIPRRATPPQIGGAQRISRAEIEQDHKIVLQYLKLQSQTSPSPLKDLQWKGPWRAERGGKRGKLYRLRYITRVNNTGDFKYQDRMFSRYFFLYDDVVSSSEPDPGDPKAITICKILDPEPLIPSEPEPRIASEPLPSRQNVQYLSDMREFGVKVSEGPPGVARFAKNGNLGYMAGNPPSGRILVNGSESPNAAEPHPKRF